MDKNFVFMSDKEQDRLMKEALVNSAEYDLYVGAEKNGLNGIIDLLRSDIEIPQDIRNQLADWMDENADSEFKLTKVQLRSAKHRKHTLAGKAERSELEQDLVLLMRFKGAEKRGHLKQAIHEVQSAIKIAAHKETKNSKSSSLFQDRIEFVVSGLIGNGDIKPNTEIVSERFLMEVWRKREKSKKRKRTLY